MKIEYLKESNRNVIGNPIQSWFSNGIDYITADNDVYIKHIKDNYVDSFELPSNAYDEMLNKSDSDLYIQPQSEFINMGNITKIDTEGNFILSNTDSNNIVLPDKYTKLYYLLKTKPKREKYMNLTKNCSNETKEEIKDYKVHIKTTEKIKKLRDLVNKDRLLPEEIYISEEELE